MSETCLIRRPAEQLVASGRLTAAFSRRMGVVSLGLTTGMVEALGNGEAGGQGPGRGQGGRHS